MIRLVVTTRIALSKNGLPNLADLQAPIGTDFTYQDQLLDGGESAEVILDLQFELFDAKTDGNLIGLIFMENVVVAEDLFMVLVDFGNGAFDGQRRC